MGRSQTSGYPLSLIKLGPTLTPEQRNQVLEVLRPFGRKLWALTNHDLAVPLNVIEHRIHCTDTSPISRKGAPKSHAENKAVGSWAQEMLECSIIGQSTSLNSAPVVIVLKRQEPGDTTPPELRVCFNYRARNERTHGDDTACPEVMPTLQSLGGSQWFGSADGKSAFHQIAMATDSRGYTAFNIRGKGSFEFLRMPFGNKTAPATFIRAMDIILEGADRLHSFIDDIKHGAPDFGKHLEDIADLASRCILHNLRLSPKKFLAGFQSLCALGFIADASGLHPDPAKVEAIMSIRQPGDTTALRSFLGMVGFYGPLIPNYSTLTAPLHGLTTRGKNVVTDWTEEHTHSFEALKAALAAAPGLAYPDVEKRFKLTTDWQPGHMADILSQMWTLESGEEVDRPLHYLAKKLAGYEAAWPATVGEQACVVWSVRRLHAYLYGVEFDLVTDHKALVAMLQCQDTTGKLARWNMELYPYDYVVHHRPGKELGNADGLSRTDKDIRAEVLNPSRISVPDVACAQSIVSIVHAAASVDSSQIQNLEGENSEAPLETHGIATSFTVTTHPEETSQPSHGDYSLSKMPASASVNSFLWDAYLDELSIESRGVKYYPPEHFQGVLAELMLSAIYPSMDLLSPDLPGEWGAKDKGCYGHAVLAHLVESSTEEISRFLEGGRPSDIHGNPLYLGLPRIFWVKVMAELHYWRAKVLDPFLALEVAWEMQQSATAIEEYPTVNTIQAFPVSDPQAAPGPSPSAELPLMDTWNTSINTEFLPPPEESSSFDCQASEEYEESSDQESELARFEQDFAEQLEEDIRPRDEMVDLNSETEDPRPEYDEFKPQREWYISHLDQPEEELDAYVTLTAHSFKHLHKSKTIFTACLYPSCVENL